MDLSNGVAMPSVRSLLMPTLLLVLALGACAQIPTPTARTSGAETLAAKHNWHRISLAAEPFNLAAFVPDTQPSGEVLTVYFEGDGFAWVSASQSSLDPTPIHPVGLELALRHPQGMAAYLARPCQYTPATSSRCDAAYWTARRFAPEVISASSMALDVLKARVGAKRLMLVGYSGGAAVAALLAARRSDVDGLITVAGNLDHRAWTSHHHINPLSGSLNPAEHTSRLRGVPQIHLAGSRDKVMPPFLASTFADRFPPEQRPKVRIVPGQEHICCWADQWPGIIKDVLAAMAHHRIGEEQ